MSISDLFSIMNSYALIPKLTSGLANAVPYMPADGSGNQLSMVNATSIRALVQTMLNLWRASPPEVRRYAKAGG